MSDNILISAEELESSIDDYVIFDCRFSLNDHDAGQQQFLESHIPGARYLHMEEALSGTITKNSGRHPLPEKYDFQKALRDSGVNNDSKIVLYDQSRFAGAARAWWLLRYFGHGSVRILNGGFAAWNSAGYSTETGNARVTDEGNITLRPGDASMISDDDEVLGSIGDGSTTIVDSRETPRYRGHAEPIDPVAGRIPGAVNVPWQTATLDNGAAVSDHSTRWQHINSSMRLIVYCGSGITASVNLLSLELAGIRNARLYPGSWSAWCSDPDKPVERDYSAATSPVPTKDNPTVELLLSRRSVLAAKMIEPSPTQDDLELILKAGIRVPDHGKIAPWRVQIVRKAAQRKLGDIYAGIVRRNEPDARDALIEAARERLQRSPLLLVVSCHPDPARFAKVPKIEQQLSAGAVCTNLLIAANALGYAAQWLTGGPAYEAEIKTALGHSADADIIGFIHLGTRDEVPKDRPRPDFHEIVSEWS